MSDAFDHHLGEDLAAIAGDGSELSNARKLELEKHVEGCTACKAAVASARLVLKTIDEARPVVPSASFDASMFARLDAIDAGVRRSERAPSWLDQLRELFTLPKLGIAVAACATLLMAIVLWNPPGRGFFFEQDRRSPEQLLTPEVAQNLDGLALAEDLELYKDLELVENLDVLDDLDAIAALDDGEGEPG